MKIRFSTGCIASLSLALGSGSAVAEILTVEITAHVEMIDDPGNALSGQVTVGQTATGRYSYETTVLDSNPNYDYGSYRQGPLQGQISFNVGALKFESVNDPASPKWTGPFEVPGDVTSPPWPFKANVSVSHFSEYPSVFTVMSEANKPLTTGTSVDFVVAMFRSFANPFYQDSLPTQAPDLTLYPERQVHVLGRSVSGQYYFVQLRIDSVSVLPQLQISPNQSSFVRPQQIDPALITKTPINVTRASVNGSPLPSSYLAQCQVVTLTAQNRAAIRCPNIVPWLLAGQNRVEWSVDLVDGSTTSSAVDWEVIE